VPDFHDPSINHSCTLRRPSCIAEALRVAALDAFEDGGYDPDHPMVGNCRVGTLSTALINAREAFPYDDIEFGFLGGKPFAYLIQSPDGVSWGGEMPVGYSLSDTVNAAVVTKRMNVSPSP